MTRREPVDLDACDKEPIHLIGAVQPHGAVLAVDAHTRRIEYASLSVETILGTPARRCLGRGLSQFIPEDQIRRITGRDLTPTRPAILRPVAIEAICDDGTRRALESVPHRIADHIILELLEPDIKAVEVWEEEALRQRIAAELVRPDTLAELAELSAEIVRGVIGFDRVMIYRFAPDKHGRVIAESTSRPDSFLDQHYPASDIPEPARRHFILNMVRAIGDIEAEASPILPAAGRMAPLDLTFARLRAVPRVHVEYLRNMGVRASCSISLVTNDELWGLIACHNYTARIVPSSKLRFLELIGGTISALLQGIENRMLLRRSIEAEKIAFAIETEGREGRLLRDLIREWAPAIAAATGSHASVLSQAGATVRHGPVPEPPLAYDVLRRRAVDGIALDDRLAETLPMTDAQREHAAGAAYLELSGDGEDFLVLHRPHFIETINWAGKPGKILRRDEDGSARLSPRGSFAVWAEERRGRSRPYDATDREVIRILRRALFALNSLERERAAVRAQKEAEAEEERLRLALLDAARRSSLGELATALAHELNQPLSAVSNYVSACRQELRNLGHDLPPEIDEIMAEAVSEAIRAGDLLRRIREFIGEGKLSPEVTDLEQAIRQGVRLADMAKRVPGLETRYEIGRDVGAVYADPVQITQVVLNLALNAMEAMRDAETRRLTISLARQGDAVRIGLRDTGRGVPREGRERLFQPFHQSTTAGMGIGLSLCRSIVEAHDGRIWFEDRRPGAEFFVLIPAEGPGA